MADKNKKIGLSAPGETSHKKLRKKVFKSKHSSEILSKLNSDRKSDGKHCDISICIGTHVFPVHKCVVCVFSDFYGSMFTTEMREKFENKANINGVSVETMETILNFIYSSEITITNYNVYDLLAAADYMQIPYVKEYCRTFLFETVNLDNCFSIRAYALSCNDTKLVKNANAYIASKFASLYQQDEFKDLNYDDFTTILQLDNKKASEEEVYQSVIGWIQHDVTARQENLSKLFQFIKLEKLSNEFLQQVVAKQPYIMSSLECSNLILLTLLNRHDITGNEVHAEQLPNAPQEVHQPPPQTMPRPRFSGGPNAGHPRFSRPQQQRPNEPKSRQRFRSPNSKQAQQTFKERRSREGRSGSAQSGAGFPQKFIILGGTGCEKNVVKYDVINMSSSRMPNISVGRSGAAAVNCNRHVYVMGGQTDKVEALNLQAKLGWMTLKNMSRCRQYLAATVLNGYIQAYGGVVSSWSQSTGEQYDHARDEWMDTYNMQSPRSAHALVAGKGALYAIGGGSGRDGSQSILNTAEMLDPRYGKWTNIPSMLTGKKALSAAILGNEIYSIGGLDANGSILSDVGCYDIRNKRWFQVASMNETRHGHCTGVVGGKIYVFGGINTKTIEQYEPTSNQWTIVGETDIVRNFACVVPA